MDAILPEADVTIPASVLLAWYDTARRDLPWRRTGVSPWQILVSEVMLQQTPVRRVQPVWEQWVQRWPTASATAAASPADVLRAWGKLGYPRRAKRLHECATIIARDHDDEVPSEVNALLTLPGIGTYTARAVASFAFGRRMPVVDTNVRRVVSRANRGVADAAPRVRELDEVAALLPADDTAARFSAALMELGATVCLARSPRCGECPLPACAWRSAGHPPAPTPIRSPQRFAGTDRQVRGRLLDVLRTNDSPVIRGELDVVWLSDAGQCERALRSLLDDGLVEQTADGRYALCGEAAGQADCSPAASGQEKRRR